MDTSYTFESFILQRIKHIEAQLKEHNKYKYAWRAEDPEERKNIMFTEIDWWIKFYSLNASIDQLYIVFTAWNNPLENEYLKKLEEEKEKKEKENKRKKKKGS